MFGIDIILAFLLQKFSPTIPEDRCQSRRRTGFSIKGIHDNELGSLVGRRQTKVEMLLGGDMLGQICRRGAGEGRTEVDVDFLLKGAEKLCGV